ncbi:class I SAM-dependent methyltransferase [Sedimentisphaera cyanobacteriorum]|nr:class I SAM-dependent methyltransferase [Sedimentisphaera cyanobacteriorum]
MKEKTDLLNSQKQKKMLHIAPEKCFTEIFSNLSHIDYLSADLNSPEAMEKIDITDINYPDESFDVIYSSHVLEHVPDDKKALTEFYRVLKPGGWMLLSIPINENLEVTDADLELDDPQERIRRFGNVDHMRVYGIDFEDKLEISGFNFEKYYPADFVSQKLIKKCNLPSQPVYICKK